MNRLWLRLADLVVPPEALKFPRRRHRWVDTWRPTHRGAHTMHLHSLRRR